MKSQFAFATLLAFVAAAAASTAGESAYPIESHDLGPEGTLTVYGIHGSEKRTLQARGCGDQKVMCAALNLLLHTSWLISHPQLLAQARRDKVRVRSPC